MRDSDAAFGGTVGPVKDRMDEIVAHMPEGEQPMPTSRAKVLAVRFRAGCLYYSGLVALARWNMRRAGRRLIILNYHRALDSDLRSHLLYLRRHYRILPLEQALEELYTPALDQPRMKDRRTPLAVTFDDGYNDNYTHAAALASELHIPITIFLIPNYIDTGNHFWWYAASYLTSRARVRAATLAGHRYDLDREDERQAMAQAIYDRAYHATSVCEREGFLSSMHDVLAVPSSPPADNDPLRPLRWAEVRDMAASGWVSFGAHTMHHPVLSYLREPDEVRHEVSASCIALEHHLGHPVRTFAYPFGRMEHIGENGSRAVQEAGLAWAVTTIRGVNMPETSPYLLQRIPIGTNRHWLALATDVAGIWPTFKREQGAMRRIVRLGRQSSHQTPSGSQHDQNVGPMPTVQVDQQHQHATFARVGARDRLGTTTERHDAMDAVTDSSDGLAPVVHGLARTSAIYAVAAMAAPLVSLVLSPFLAHNLSRTDYGALAVLTTIVALMAGVTQLGLGSAFFRAYNYDYRTKRDRLRVVSTVVVLLAVVTLPTAITGMILAPKLASILLGSASYTSAVKLAALVVLVQNLSVPGFAWLRAESRAAIYSIISIINVIVVLAGTIVLVGILQDGLAGALLATAAGYACVVVLTLPVALVRAGLHVSYDVAWNLLTFGVPMLVNVITIWVLQLSDRFLLAQFGSLTQTASYDVAYKLGGVLSPVILAPFQLAWPTALFAIAQRNDARLMFQRVFRWYSSFLLLATYVLSLTGIALLHLLFPPTYQAASAIIPIIGLSLMFYGLSMVVGIGIPIQRKMWLGAMYVGISAMVNVGLNIVWIPRYGAMAAAWSTLIAYFVLVASDYIVNQRIYPVPFEIGRFIVALLVGVALFSSCTVLTELRPGIWGWAAQGLGIVVYGVWLFLWAAGYHALRMYWPQALRANRAGSVRQRANGQTRAILPQPSEHLSSEAGVPARICMHVLGTARLDVRVMREARTLAQTGLAVSIVDVEQKRGVPQEEDIDGVTVKHIVMPAWFLPTRFKPWFLIKAIQVLTRGALDLWRTPADLYHAHDYNALPACYLAARLRRKPLIFDAHELPLVDPNVTRWQLLCAMYVRLLRAIVPRCAGIITVSPPIASELAHRYGGPAPIVLRNIPPYRAPTQRDHLRQRLDLGPHMRIALYQGSLQDDRGLDTLIHAAKFLDPNIVIVLMGRGPRQLTLQRLIAHEGVGSAVWIIPPVAYDELLNWTGSADIGLIVNPASYSQNVEMCLPNKLFEYLMAGVPVLSSRLAAVEAIIADYDVGRIVDPLEPEPVARAVSALLADHDGLERMRRNAMIATQRDLKWEVEQERLIDLYHQILNPRSRSLFPAEQTAMPIQSDICG